jgi:hypothetical protein
MEIINSFFTNIKDKLTNPFFGTLILVLIFHHWELWFSLFNFDNDCTLGDKIIFIKTYLESNLTLSLFAWNVTQAIFFMFVGYLVIVGTRSLVMWVEFWLMPFITGKIVNKNVVRKSEFDDVVKEREEYFDQYEEQRKNVRIFSKTIDEQTQQIKLKDENLLEQSIAISKSIEDLEITNKKLDNLKSEHKTQTQKTNELSTSFDNLQKENVIKIKQLEIFKSLFFSQESKSFYSTIDKFPPEIIDKVNELKNENKWRTFKHVGNFFQKGGSMGGEQLSEMIEKGIAFERNMGEDFTPIGNIIWHYRNIFDEYDIF